MSEPESPVVLVVEDERPVADLFSTWLKQEYQVRTAYTGEEALELADAEVDAILLDRRLPDISGDEVLGRLRERGIDCRVAMVTAVDPDFDVLKLDIDEYITKPVDREDLLGVVEELLKRDSLDTHVREYLALASKKSSLEQEKTPNELRSHPEYTSLLDELTQVREQLTTNLIEQITYRNILRLHRSTRQIGVDIGLISVVAILLVSVHVLFPPAAEVLASIDAANTNILSLYVATFLHISTEHLLGNAIGFLAVGVLTYILCMRMLATRWFYLTGMMLIVATPVITGTLTYSVFELVGREEITFVGFSAVVSGFVGFSFLAFLVLMRTIYDHRSVLYASGFILFLSATLILILQTHEAALAAGAWCLVMLVLFAVERYSAVRQGVEELRPAITNVVAVAVIGAIYAAFGVGIVPAVTLEAYPGTVGHLIGFVSGFVIAQLTASFLNIFPIRDELQNKGLALPNRLL